MKGQTCFTTEEGFAFCGYAQQQVPLSPQWSLFETKSCAMSACPSVNNPCGYAPCAVINGLIACLHPNSPLPITNVTDSPIITTTASSTDCSTNLCNGNPCIVISGIPQCFCLSGYGPNCTSETTTPATNQVCQPGACNGNPCLLINGIPQCFCPAGTIPPNCQMITGTSTATTTSTGTSTITTRSSTGTTVVVASCPPGSCNGQPCVITNGVLSCFCTNGSNQPDCGFSTGTTTTTTITSTPIPVFSCFLLPQGNPCPVNIPCLVIQGQPVCYDQIG